MAEERCSRYPSYMRCPFHGTILIFTRHFSFEHTVHGAFAFSSSILLPRLFSFLLRIFFQSGWRCPSLLRNSARQTIIHLIDRSRESSNTIQHLAVELGSLKTSNIFHSSNKIEKRVETLIGKFINYRSVMDIRGVYFKTGKILRVKVYLSHIFKKRREFFGRFSEIRNNV